MKIGKIFVDIFVGLTVVSKQRTRGLAAYGNVFVLPFKEVLDIGGRGKHNSEGKEN